VSAGAGPLGRLYLVATPRPGQPDAELLARVRAALDGGVDVLQLRCKDAEALPYLRLAERVGELARAAGVPFLVNDRPDVALAAGADGVHLGQQDLPVAWARRVFPRGLIGRSSHEPAHAERAVAEGADYFAVGPVWATPTKPGRAAAGLSYVRDVAARGVAVPWFAIGGITAANVSQVLDAGAVRVAVVRAILDARDPAEAARAFADTLACVGKGETPAFVGMRGSGIDAPAPPAIPAKAGISPVRSVCSEEAPCT
jgi:thiamine-phosphate pyrophosphorylase